MFFTASYLILLSAGIMASVSGTGERDMAVLFCLMAAAASLLTGFLSNLPFAAAPGLGFALLFSQTLVGRYGYSYTEALPIVFLSGFIFLVISLTPLRNRLLEAIPLPLKFAVSAGLGLMIALSGLINAGLVTAEGNLLDMGKLISPGPLLALAGVFLTAAFLLRRVPGAVLLGMLVITLLGIPFGVTELPEKIFTGWKVSFVPLSFFRNAGKGGAALDFRSSGAGAFPML